jgi:hypothetical protein
MATLYADSAVEASGDGSSWAQAFKTLAELAAALGSGDTFYTRGTFAEAVEFTNDNLKWETTTAGVTVSRAAEDESAYTVKFSGASPTINGRPAGATENKITIINDYDSDVGGASCNRTLYHSGQGTLHVVGVTVLSKDIGIRSNQSAVILTGCLVYAAEYALSVVGGQTVTATDCVFDVGTYDQHSYCAAGAVLTKGDSTFTRCHLNAAGSDNLHLSSLSCVFINSALGAGTFWGCSFQIVPKTKSGCWLLGDAKQWILDNCDVTVPAPAFGPVVGLLTLGDDGTTTIIVRNSPMPIVCHQGEGLAVVRKYLEVPSPIRVG